MRTAKKLGGGFTIGLRIHTNYFDDENVQWRSSEAPKHSKNFTALQASILTHFNQERHLYSRQNFKDNRSATLAEWRKIAAWDRCQ